MPKNVNSKLVQEYDEGSEIIKDRRESVFSKRDVTGITETEFTRSSILDEVIHTRIKHVNEMRKKPLK